MPIESPLKVVILDDHPIIIDGIRLLIDGNENFEVTGQASSVQELISLLSSPADLLILDLNISGKNIVKHIPDIHSRSPHLKILVFSSYNIPSLVRKVFMQQVDGYLLKDTTQDELIGALECIASGKRFIGRNVKVPQKGLNGMITEPELADDFEKKHQLTDREMDVIRRMAKGEDSKAIASQLFISLHTVQTHRKNILRKLGLHSAVEVVRFAIKNGLS
ncbi:MAG: response regulator transcription factor [Saprospiraceae bacterium]|nr:response regulator transcription factor [Saprospiraceae bacterium]MCF8249757.1 response regulator transcription factor [Saprospiraceae bacterium]MCF8279242.1 response regulator transcription factor [Bacteroidales bacterium]MCF8312790.1 response regulator transcription factor [Saprospiraceae bacterium]MCF8441237.1 response regulator transcription factor [Saprospiraceae bacterium]